MFGEIWKQAVGDWINWVIVFLFIAVWVALSAVHKNLKQICDHAAKIYRMTKSNTKIDKASGTMGYTIRNEVDPEAMDNVREQFNAESTKYLSLVQMVSLFPMLGLFGTVLGLIPGLAAMSGGDVKRLYEALCTALISTFLGLLFGIVLKAYVSLGHSKTINTIENTLDENDRKYNLLINFNKVSGSEPEL